MGKHIELTNQLQGYQQHKLVISPICWCYFLRMPFDVQITQTGVWLAQLPTNQQNGAEISPKSISAKKNGSIGRPKEPIEIIEHLS